MIASFVSNKSDMERRLALIQRLRNAPAGLDEALEKPIRRGVAYHHAGLTTEERELIEEAYDTGVLKVLAVTPHPSSSLITGNGNAGSRNQSPLPPRPFPRPQNGTRSPLHGILPPNERPSRPQG
jgi:hypothetical protein